MKYNLSILFFAITFLSIAQDKNPTSNRYLKVYNLVSQQKIYETWTDSLQSYHSSHSELKIFHPTIAFGWKGKKQGIHELELNTLFLNKNDDNVSSTYTSNKIPVSISGAKIISSTLSLRYEYIINIMKASNSKLKPSVGLAANPYYNQYKVKPNTTQAFPSSDVTFGAKGFIIPRLIYTFSSKCFIDLNIPVVLFDANITSSTNHNPAIPIRQQRTSLSDFKFIPKQFSLRFGVGIKI